jgi:hypothetical protein
MLICSERKVLLVGDWFFPERKVLLAGGYKRDEWANKMTMVPLVKAENRSLIR